jgi:peptidoglycan/LPS O-acetylase OafA/YrhL
LIIPAIAIFYLLDLKLARIPAHSFLSGMLVAILVRTHFVKYLQGFPSAFISTCLIIFSILKFSDPFSFYPLIILSFFFSVVASGNSFFGIFSLRVSRVMGEISFGIYLLHGILLFTLLRLFLGDSKSIALHQYEYWGYILFCTPILIIICYLTFRIIEKPCMNLTMGVEKKITSLFYR